MKVKTKRYKKLMRVLLKWLFTEHYDVDFLEQVVLRFAHRDGYVEIDESNGFDFVFSDKGLRLIKE